MPILRPRARPFATPRGQWARALIVALVTILAVGSSVAGAAAEDDPAAKREQVRKQRAEVASRVDVLRASDADVKAALSDLDANVGAQQAVVASAQQAADLATRQRDEKREAERRKAEELAAIKVQMSKIAVEAYMSPLKSSLVNMLKSQSLNDASMRREFLDIGANHGADVTRQLKAAKADLEVERAAAEAAQRKATERQAEVQDQLTSLRQAADQQRQVAAQVEGRIESSLAEAAALSAVDNQLSEQISTRQAALAAQLKASSEASAQARAATRGSDPAGDAPVAPVAPVARPSGTPGLSTVGGITVASSIAGQLEALLGAASADGIEFGGSGYRDSSSQVALRSQNCGSSDYAIYEMSPSSCSPPTARPGSSMHEQGLAIDFTYGGSVIGSRSSPGYQWLAGNAGGYGFYNLPSEPWHWSTTGS